MATELEELIGEDPKEPTPPLEEVTPVTEPEEDPEVKAKREELSNLDKAVKEEQARLAKIRKERQQASRPVEDDEEEIPKIDLTDPSAKAWDQRIRQASEPARQELEKAKEERRLYALKQFLVDKPALAKSPEKLKEMMETYDRLKTSTELTGEGIFMDLEKAYAATHYEELLSGENSRRLDRARADAAFSEIATHRGGTSYSEERPQKKVLSEEERDIIREFERHGAPKVD